MARQATSNRNFNNRSKAEQAPAPEESGVIFKVEHVRDWGRNGEFVAFPQRKGKDGQYYKHAWMALDDDQTAEIISAVYDALED